MSEQKERIAFIDVLKGVAIISVVLGHVVDGYYKSNLYPNQNHVFWAIFVIIYSFHMSLFFVISGYLYGLAYIKERVTIDHCKMSKQIKRLTYVYFVWSFLMWSFKSVFRTWVNSEVRFIDIFLLFIKTIEPYWYLYVLIILYFIFSFERIQKIEWKKCLLVLGLISIGASCMPVIHWFEVTRLLYFSVFFFLGQCVAQKKIVLDKRVVFFGLIAVSMVILYFPRQIDRIGGISLICSFGLSITLFWIFQKYDMECKKSKLLMSCGKYSLEIYVMHCFFTAFFRTVLYKIGFSLIPLNVLLNLILSTFVPIVISICMKRIHVYKFFFGGRTIFRKMLYKRQ